MHACMCIYTSLLQGTTAVKPNRGKCSKSRTTAVNVFLLKTSMPGTKVPKNAVRQEMVQEERCKTLYFSRDDNPTHVQEIIKSAFGLESYTILDCNKKGSNLFVSPLKIISGKQAIERRKALYLCEVSYIHAYACISIYYIYIYIYVHSA